jgi:major membrane immunogen (membrane-anchored lipoprotein)
VRLIRGNIRSTQTICEKEKPMRHSTIAIVLAVISAGILLAGCATKSDLGASGAPANVTAAFHEKYPGATIEKVEKEVYKDGTVHYEFIYRDANGKKQDVELDVNGNLAH